MCRCKNCQLQATNAWGGLPEPQVTPFGLVPRKDSSIVFNELDYKTKERPDFVEDKLIAEGYVRLTLEQAQELSSGTELMFYTGNSEKSICMSNAMIAYWDIKYLQGGFTGPVVGSKVSDFWIRKSTLMEKMQMYQALHNMTVTNVQSLLQKNLEFDTRYTIGVDPITSDKGSPNKMKMFCNALRKMI